MRGRPVDAQTIAAVKTAAADGLGRNAIARKLGIGAATVTGIAQDLGIVFDWSQSELAVRAHSIQAAAARHELAQMAFARAYDALYLMDAPQEFTTVDDEGAVKHHVRSAPTISDQRNLATVFGIMVEKAAFLSRVAEGNVSGEATSALSELARVMAIAADAFDGASDPTAEPVNISRQQMIEDLQADDAHDSSASPTSDQD